MGVKRRMQPGKAIRAEFPFFQGPGARAAYLDSAASSQKPRRVIDRLAGFLSREYSNIHRGAYALCADATRNYANSRSAIAGFLHAPGPESIVFTRGATEGVNLVSVAAEDFFAPGDGILLTQLEHHSNIVPWQLLARRRGVQLHFAKITPDARLDTDDFARLVDTVRPELCAFTHLSNAFGSSVDAAGLIAHAQAAGSLVLLDAAQSVVHEPIDVQQLKPDFLVFSGHKLYGPMGIGVLYGRPELLERMQPYQGGGGMIDYVSEDGSSWAALPAKFEAGTPPVAEALGLASAVEFVQEVGFEALAAHETALLEHAWSALRAEARVELYGPGPENGAQRSIISFGIEGVHAHDIATVADSLNLQLRAGHHCAMPALHALDLPATARISFGVYSDIDDIERLLEVIAKVRKVFA